MTPLIITRMILVTARANPERLTCAEGHPAMDYFQRLGITGDSDADLVEWARAFVLEDLGSTLEGWEDQGPPDFRGEDSDLLPMLRTDIHARGIWYASGRAFFHDGEDDDEDEV